MKKKSKHFVGYIIQMDELIVVTHHGKEVDLDAGDIKTNLILEDLIMRDNLEHPIELVCEL